MTKKKVNIYDVAKKAGVGIGTVSRVLNQSSKVRNKTKEKVLKVIEDLNYHPNRAAQNLASKKANAIAVILPTFVDHFFVEVLKGVQGALEEKKIDLILHKLTADKNMVTKILNIIQSGRVDGILAVSLDISSVENQKLLNTDIPIVLADQKSSDFHSLYFNDQKGAEMAINHLIAAGHQKIAFINGKKESKVAAERLLGVKKALQKNNLKLKAELLKFSDFQSDAAYKSMQKILSLPKKDWPTAVFAASDNQALGIIKLLEEKKIEIPKKIAVIGYDNIELAQFLKITTVAQPMYELGQNSVELLLKAIDGQLEGIYQQELELKLIARKTT